ELVKSLSTFIKNNPHACAKEAAIHFGVSPKFLRENFPVQNASLVTSGRRYRQQQSQARLDAKERAYEESLCTLVDQNVYPSRRKVTKHLKELGIRLTFEEERRAKRKADATYGFPKPRGG